MGVVLGLGNYRLHFMSWPTDDELAAAGWIRISRRNRLILSRPRFGQVYWVDFPHDAYAPEFVGEHPGVVIRAASSLHEPCTVVPLTSRDQRRRPHTYELTVNPNPRQDTPVWAVCDHLYTVSIERLRPFLDRYKNQSFPKVCDADCREISRHVHGALGSLHAAASTEVLPGLSETPRPEAERPPGARPILRLKGDDPAR